MNKHGMNSLVMWARTFLIILTIFVGLKAVTVIKSYDYVGRENGVVPHTITVQGMGEVLATPDTAEFTYIVSEDAATATAAADKAATKANIALAAVKAAGVAEADIKTLSYNLSPKYEYNQIVCVAYPCPAGKQTIVGYTVSESVDVKVRKIDDAGALIAKISGLSVSNVSGVNFIVDKPEAVQNEAKSKAIDNAESKAKTLAKQLGVRLGHIVSFSDSYSPIYYGKTYDVAGVSANSAPSPATPELSVGQNSVVSNVSVTYEIN